MGNDTGSNRLSLYPAYIANLLLSPNYAGWGEVFPCLTAGGVVQRQSLVVQIQLLDQEMEPLSDWILEDALIDPNGAQPGGIRLSGQKCEITYILLRRQVIHCYVCPKKRTVLSIYFRLCKVLLMLNTRRYIMTTINVKIFIHQYSVFHATTIDRFVHVTWFVYIRRICLWVLHTRSRFRSNCNFLIAEVQNTEMQY